MQVPIKYLFVAVFRDGHSISQNPEDRSSFQEGRNCYTDVVEYAKVSPLEVFIRKNKEHVYAVDLRDGHFEVNGRPFLMHDPSRNIVRQFRLVQFMRNFPSFNVTYRVEEDRSLNVTDVQPISHLRDFAIGWEGENQTGQRLERVMFIPGDF